MKTLLIIMALISSNALGSEYTREREREHNVYLEEANFRLNNIYLLNQILKQLQIIRCQGEISTFCDKLYEQLDKENAKNSNDN